MNLRILFSAVTFALAASFAGSAHANLVTNSGFETGDFSGWTLGGGTDFRGVDYVAPHSGTYAAFFGAQGTPTTLSQDIATIIGATYEVSFWLQNGFSGPNSFSSSFGGQSLTSLSNANAFGYQQLTFLVVATSANSLLQFAFSHDPSFWDLDDVSVELVSDVPVPGALLFFVTSILGFGVARRREKAY